MLIALAILAGSMWLRGSFVSDTLRVDGGAGVTLHAFSGQGSVAFAVTTGGEYFKGRAEGKTSWWAYSAARPPIDFHARWAGLGNETRFSRGGFVAIREPARGTVFGALAPCATIAAALAGLAMLRVAWFRLYTRRRRRLAAGLCPDCGHDIPALADRCPGCGRRRSRGGTRIGRVRSADARRAA